MPVVGLNSATYTTASLSNGNIVKCAITSNASCLSTSVGTSNLITVAFSARVTPTLAIAKIDKPVCAGTTVVFTNSSTNHGTVPVYR